MISYKRTVIWRTLGFIFLICLMLSNCVYFRMTHLSNEDLEWIQCYNRFPSPKFISESGKVAKLSYQRVWIENSTNRFYISSNGSYTYEATAGYGFDISQSDTVFQGWFSITKFVNENNLWVSFSLNHFTSDKIKQFNYIPLQTHNFEMDSVIYNDCIIADSTNAYYSPYQIDKVTDKIDKFVISKKYGLLYYRFQNGEEYKRQFKRKKKEV